MVASRRDLLCSAAALAMTGLAPAFAAAQVFTATSISMAAQQARRDVGRLGHRADSLLRQTAADGAERGSAAVRRFKAGQANLARDLAAIFNGRVSEDDFLLIVPTRELDLVLTMQPLVIRIAPRPDEVEAALKEPLPRIEPQPDNTAEDVVLAITLASLGVRGDDRSMFAQLRDDDALAGALKDTAAAVKAGRYGLAALELERLMRFVVLPRNIEMLSGGSSDRARAIYKGLVVRFAPFLGWTLFTALLLVTIYQNRDSTAPVPR
jgi:hypothetical protein